METAEVEVQLPGGSLVWAPLHVGDDGKKVWAMLPSGEKLGTDITPLLLACSKRLGQKRSAAEMCRAPQALQEPPLKQAKASRDDTSMGLETTSLNWFPNKHQSTSDTSMGLGTKTILGTQACNSLKRGG